MCDIQAMPLILTTENKYVQSNFNEQAPPSMIIAKDVNGNLTYSGVNGDIIDELFRRLHWTYVYHFILTN